MKLRPPPAAKRKPFRATSPPAASAGSTPELRPGLRVSQEALRLVPVGEEPGEDAALIRWVRPVGSPSHVMPFEPVKPGRAPWS